MSMHHFLRLTDPDGKDVLWILPDAEHFKVAFWDDRARRWIRQGLTFSPAGLGAIIRYLSSNTEVGYGELRRLSLTWSKL